MEPVPISLGLRSNPGRDGALGSARLINCYAINAGSEAKSEYPLVACNGFTSFATITGGGVLRALLPFSPTLAYGVSGSVLFRTTSAGVTINLATYSTTGTVTMARNRRQPSAQIAVVSSDGLFRMIEGNVVTSPAIPEGVTFNSVCSIDGYFILTCLTGEWFITAIDDGGSIDELDFAEAESSPDGLLIGMVRGTDLCLFGPQSIEFWQNSGGDDFPFERVSVASMGCYAAGSVRDLTAVIDGQTTDTIAFAGTDAAGAYIGVFLLNGYGAQKISSEAVDRSIRLEGTLTTNIKAFTYVFDGHVFYTITGATFTWEYNTTTGLWHERQSSSLPRWRVNDAASFAGRTIIGDYTLGLLYSMAPTVVSASASTVSIQTSRDNGDTYTAARSTTISASDRKQRFKWNRLGQSKEDGKVIKITITNAINENGTGVPMTVIPPHVHSWPKPTRMGSLYVDVVPASSTTSRPKAISAIAITATPVNG